MNHNKFRNFMSYLLSSSLSISARIGANVTGIDASAANISAARAHAERDPVLMGAAGRLTYLCTSVENLSSKKE
jgi:2-polyprenyl-3-methyl-5-hydroxy-6-metoxy-1,4-benzoquinol methylase